MKKMNFFKPSKTISLIPKKEIEELKTGSYEYDKAIDDVLKLLNDVRESSIVIHAQTGLFFNGYNSPFPKGKNTLSQTNHNSVRSYGRTHEEILELAFEGHITKKNDGKKYVWNNIVYEGSQINKILSEIYSDTQYIPLADFRVQRKEK